MRNGSKAQMQNEKNMAPENVENKGGKIRADICRCFRESFLKGPNESQHFVRFISPSSVHYAFGVSLD